MLVSAMMILVSVGYLRSPQFKTAFQHLGYPDHFRIELAVAKMLGAIALIVPIGPRLKEWAYAGFTFTFLAAIVAHLSSGDTLGEAFGPMVFLILLGISYGAYLRGSPKVLS